MADQPQSFGQFLMGEALPPEIQQNGPLSKRVLQTSMSAYAKSNPRGYVQAVQDLKRVGDQVSTWEGLSVGLDDIAPDYARRDPIMQDALRQVRAAKTDADRRRIVKATEGLILESTKHHPSDMALMARSGGRGSFAQLMKTVSSPVAATDVGGSVNPWLITKSYAQGLNPADGWVANIEARRGVIDSTGSVVEPGAVAKVIVTNMQNLVVTTPDCRTTRGIRLDVNDQIEDRYLAQGAGGFSAGTLVSPEVATALKKQRVTHVYVRSPMTCEASDGVCQMCMGRDEWGKAPTIGRNVGVRSAQALTEPLTQFALNAKHGVRLAGKGNQDMLRGLHGMRVLTEVPKTFTGRATLAQAGGTVDTVTKAPQGGWHITVGGDRHYAPPGLKPIIKPGKMVEAGDALTEGVAMPDEVVHYKGIGEGRRYLSDQLTDLFRRQGVDIDRRHTELLAKNAVNYVQVEDDPTNTFIPGDVVRYNAVEKVMGRFTDTVPLSQARGKSLGAPILHFSAGTLITPSVEKILKRENVSVVPISTGGPSFTPIMKSVIQTPLLDDDWMSRLSHRYLKRTLVEGAGFGLSSDYAGTNPVPAYALGTPFGLGPEGKYAESTHTRTQPDGEELDVWKLVAALKGRDTEEVQLSDLSPSRSRRDGFSPKRLENADVDFPIVLDENGDLIDGRHRALKLMDQGEEVANAYRASADDLQNALIAPDSQAMDYKTLFHQEKNASFLNTLRRVAIGSGKKFEDIPGKKMISRWGAMDPEAHEARKVMGWMPDSMKRRMNFFEGPGETLSDAGAQKFRAVENLLPTIFRRDLGKTPFDAHELKRLRDAGVNVSPQEFEAIQNARGGKASIIGRGLREFALGEAPLDTLKQRFELGGLVGPGGVFLGDLGPDPASTRAFRDFRKRKPFSREGLSALGRLGMYGGMDLTNKAFSYGMPAYMAYNLATGDENVEKGHGRGSALGEIAGDVGGWAFASPFGLVGGLPIATAATELGSRIGGLFDPPTAAPARAAAPSPDAPMWQRATMPFRRTLQNHPYAQYYDLAGQGADAAGGVYGDLRSQYEQQRNPMGPALLSRGGLP